MVVAVWGRLPQSVNLQLDSQAQKPSQGIERAEAARERIPYASALLLVNEVRGLLEAVAVLPYP
jgi:hypothetical protein